MPREGGCWNTDGDISRMAGACLGVCYQPSPKLCAAGVLNHWCAGARNHRKVLRARVRQRLQVTGDAIAWVMLGVGDSALLGLLS